MGDGLAGGELLLLVPVERLSPEPAEGVNDCLRQLWVARLACNHAGRRYTIRRSQQLIGDGLQAGTDPVKETTSVGDGCGERRNAPGERLPRAVGREPRKPATQHRDRCGHLQQRLEIEADLLVQIDEARLLKER